MLVFSHQQLRLLCFFKQAMMVMFQFQGLDETARSLAGAAASEHARGRGLSGAVGGVLRQVPSTLVRPVIVATTATTNVLEGVKNQVAPEDYHDEQEKWKEDE